MKAIAAVVVTLASVASGVSPAYSAGVEVGFSPDGSAERLVVRAIDGAHREILMSAYSFTDRYIAKALVDAYKRGVKVEAVLDKSQRRARYTAATFLAHAGIPVRIDSRHAIMHDKYLIIDGDSVETGSFNYTTAAAKHNAENALLITHDEPLARRYTRDWEMHWEHSQPYRTL